MESDKEITSTWSLQNIVYKYIVYNETRIFITKFWIIRGFAYAEETSFDFGKYCSSDSRERRDTEPQTYYAARSNLLPATYQYKYSSQFKFSATLLWVEAD